MRPATKATRGGSFRRRGQSMVLFALTLMLLALMVLVTLSIGARVSERIELQTMADASAYSNAVASARAFNSISLMNRTQISHMAVAAGLESIVNFSSAYFAHVAMALQIWLSFGTCTVDPNTCDVVCYVGGRTECEKEVRRAIKAGAQGIANELCRVMAGYPGKDAAAAAEVLLAVSQAFALHEVEKEVYAKLQSEVLSKQRLASVIARSSGALEVSAPPGVDSITLRELVGGEQCKGRGAACIENAYFSHSYYAAMGTRGSGFITARAGAKGMMNAQLVGKPWPFAAAAVTGGGVLDLADAPVKQALGSAYFYSDVPSHGSDADGRALTADDHGLQAGSFGYHVPDENMKGFCCLQVRPGEGESPCGNSHVPDETYRNFFRSGELQTYSHLKSTDSDDNGDLHEWGRRIGFSRFIPLRYSDTGAAAIHSTLGCKVDCPGIWPLFIDHNQSLVTKGEDLFGQPKNYALLQRDYAARPPDPWNLFFRFQFSKGTPSVFDNRGLSVRGGLDISKQNAFATGLAYYHRMGHWKEPPNFLNPYWRATLVPWDADAQGKGSDVPDLLRAAGAPEAARSIELLRNNGFRGAH
ncbi:MAG: hypothetical protein ACYC8T_35440 [Myxococcaceae bacterium]